MKSWCNVGTIVQLTRVCHYLLLLQVSLITTIQAFATTRTSSSSSIVFTKSCKYNLSSASFPVPTFIHSPHVTKNSLSSTSSSRPTLSYLLSSSSVNDIETVSSATTEGSNTANTNNTITLPFQNRGKVNEIDFCMAPSDVSLSRSYASKININNNTTKRNDDDSTAALSLTRALNNISNRAVRRILLSRSWPSAEALNLSLRQILASDRKKLRQQQQQKDANSISTESTVDVVDYDTANYSNSIDDTDSPKCPVPRPILNIIMRRSGLKYETTSIGEVPITNTSNNNSSTASISSSSSEKSSINPRPLQPKSRTDQEWVSDQINTFRQTYGQLPGYYEYADAYLECILNLATTGIESERVSEVLAGGVYDEAYRRVLSVIKSVGATFEKVDDYDYESNYNNTDNTLNTTTTTSSSSRIKIASKLIDQDICLSMLDRINIEREKENPQNTPIIIMPQKSVLLQEKGQQQQQVKEEVKEIVQEIKTPQQDIVKQSTTNTLEKESQQLINASTMDNIDNKTKKRFNFFSWLTAKTPSKNNNKKSNTDDLTIVNGSREPLLVKDTTTNDPVVGTAVDNEFEEEEDDDEILMNTIKPEDLGAVLLSAEEPTMTRQLNVLSNIVMRALLFGGDQELLVLSETLEADKPAFIQRWYPGTKMQESKFYDESIVRPGVQYFNCLVQLLKESYNNQVVTNLSPPLPLSQSYANSYERLMSTLIKMGSGYIKPAVDDKKMLSTVRKTPTEEFRRFTQLETTLRKNIQDQDLATNYPSELLGTWQVRDEVGGKTIGTSTVVFKSDGEVYVEPPAVGLQWRMDPGPTHLDTYTFQVLSDDGAILQYRGFMDRGARLESRFSKRSLKIRGAVTFQMRDSDSSSMNMLVNMPPISTEIGTTRFVMTKVFDLNDN